MTSRHLPCTTRRGVLGAFRGSPLLGAAPRAAARGAGGRAALGAHVSLAPTWFDPAETSGIITPFMVLYALHDAMVKAMPGDPWRRAWPNPGPWRPTG